MDALNYALSKKLRKYIDSALSSVSGQVQSDWLEQDETALGYVKNKICYDEYNDLVCAFDIDPADLGENVYDRRYANITDIPDDLLCVEINGKRFANLTRYNPSLNGISYCIGSFDTYGFCIYDIYDSTTIKNIFITIDENRFGPIAEMTASLYKLSATNKINSRYLPLSSSSEAGVVMTTRYDEIPSGYGVVISDATGYIFAKEYKAANIYSELSITNLNFLSYNGDHGLFTDSIAEEISSSVDLVLPVHAWYLGYDYSNYTQKYMLESSDGRVMLVKLKNLALYSISILYEIPPSAMTVTVTRNDDGTYSADKTFEEISEAYDSGVCLHAVMPEDTPFLYNLVAYSSDTSAIFMFTFPGETEGRFIIITKENAVNLDTISNSVFEGASSNTNGHIGAVPAPSAGDQDKFLKGDGTWGELPLSFNDSGELVVTLNGISKTFVPKS